MDSIPFYELDDVEQITFYISWPEAGALDRSTRIITFKDGSFTIKKDGLYEKMKKVYTLKQAP
ncbi:TNF domain-containing protein [Niabella hibiscisoli]|uniref:hypothetical protein n=1 Tax=Niabella hibiscisoli TaxID=1825928 RepID=UPI001F0F2642|nr:hypothetical protein [Niabella hibiscisoli]MCH5719824.1 hypothetical protein [Niabella hibiscisoli]